MKFDILTIFPEIFSSYFSESIIKRAQEAGAIDIAIHNIRDWSTDKHKTVDDTPYGGGAGMVIKIEPIWRCVQSINSKVHPVKSLTSQGAASPQFNRVKTRVILFSAKGKKYTQADAERFLKYDNLIFICGRYEGVDERVAENIADEEISIGEYVLTGGEIPAMVVLDSVTRLLPGVLGNPDSLKEESFSTIQNSKFKIQNSVLEYPQYTKPEEFKGWKVPDILLSGNHQEIEKWRREKSETKSNDLK